MLFRLCSLLNPYDSLKHLECDGLTQVFHRILTDEQIEHTVNIGEVIHKPTNRTIPIHYWIDVGSLRIDYRLKMWFGETLDIPHGVFYKDSKSSVCYLGEPVDVPLLPMSVIQTLIKPFDSEENVDLMFKRRAAPIPLDNGYPIMLPCPVFILPFMN